MTTATTPPAVTWKQVLPPGSVWRNNRTRSLHRVIRHYRAWTDDHGPRVVYSNANSTGRCHPIYFVDSHRPVFLDWSRSEAT